VASSAKLSDPGPDIVSSSLLSKKCLVTAQGNRVRAIAKSNGKLRWKANIDLPPASNSTGEWPLPGLDSSLVGDSVFVPVIPDSLLNGMGERGPQLLLAQTSSEIFAGGGNKLAGLSQADGDKRVKIDLDELNPQDSTGSSYLTALAGSPSLVFTATASLAKNGVVQERRLSAFNAETGDIVWSTQMSDLSSKGDKGYYPHFIFDIAYSNGLLIALTSSQVVALDVNTGEMQWQTPLEGLSMGLIPNSGAALLADGDELYITNTISGGALMQLNTLSGTVNWKDSRTDNSNSDFIFYGQVVLANERIYRPFSHLSINGGGGNIFDGKRNSGVKVLDAQSGAVLETIKASDIQGIEENSALSFLNGIAVKNQYLVTQGIKGTYCIKLQRKREK
jgi:outer membrane protein assembly factor BamB